MNPLLVLALAGCEPVDDADPPTYEMTVTYGSYVLVADDFTSPGRVHGYLVNGEFGLPTLVANPGDTLELTVHNETWDDISLVAVGGVDLDTERITAPPGETTVHTWQVGTTPGAFAVKSAEVDDDGVEYQARSGLLGVLRVLEEGAEPSQMVTLQLVDAYEPWTEGLAGEAPTGDDGHDDHDHKSRDLSHTDLSDTSSGGQPVLKEGEHGDHGESDVSTLGDDSHTLVTQMVSGEAWGVTDTRESAVVYLGPGAVDFNVVALGGEVHSLRLGGLSWTDADGSASDTLLVGPGSARTVSAGEIPDAGLLTFQCQVEGHDSQEVAWLSVDAH